MPLPTPRYAFDPTGAHPNNKVVGELKELNSNRPVRAYVPRFSAFYTATAVLYDVDNNRVLTRGTDGDFVFGDIVRIGSDKTGLEMSTTILIINPGVSNKIRLDYQVVGGMYQNVVAGLENLYETLLRDQRPVDWVDILNKPHTFPPSQHKHLLPDVVGFEFVAAAIDRLTQAVTLTNVPAFEALIDWVIANVPQVATLPELELGMPMNKVLSVTGLQFILQKYNFNAMKISPSKATLLPGAVQVFDLTSTNIPDGTVLYWTIKHLETSDADFPYRSGSMTVFDNKATFNVAVGGTSVNELAERFQIEIRRSGLQGPVMMESNILTVSGTMRNTRNDMIEALAVCCLGGLSFRHTPAAFYANRSGKSPVY